MNTRATREWRSCRRAEKVLASGPAPFAYLLGIGTARGRELGSLARACFGLNDARSLHRAIATIWQFACDPGHSCSEFLLRPSGIRNGDMPGDARDVSFCF